jgi:hypothetical protein
MASIRSLAVVMVGVLLLAGCEERPPQSASAATDRDGQEIGGLEAEGEVATLKGADAVLERGERVIEGSLDQVDSDVVDAEEASDDATAAGRALSRDVRSDTTATAFGALSNADETDMSSVDSGASSVLDLSGSPDEVIAKAETLLKQVHQYINGDKFEMAEQGLSKLQSVKHMLPQTLQDQIPVAEQLLQAAKTIAEKLDGLEMVK